MPNIVGAGDWYQPHVSTKSDIYKNILKPFHMLYSE